MLAKYIFAVLLCQYLKSFSYCWIISPVTRINLFLYKYSIVTLDTYNLH